MPKNKNINFSQVLQNALNILLLFPLIFQLLYLIPALRKTKKVILFTNIFPLPTTNALLPAEPYLRSPQATDYLNFRQTSLIKSIFVGFKTANISRLKILL